MADGARPLSHAEVEELAAGFVLGSLSPTEMVAVREHVASCPDAHPELEALGATVAALALAAPEAQPSVALGSRILGAARAEAARINADRTEGARTETAASVAAATAATTSAAPLGAGTAVERGRVIADVAPRASGPRPPTFLRRPAFALTALAAIVVVALAAWNLQLQGQVSDLEAYRTGVAAVLDTASAPGARLAALNADSTAGPNGLAVVAPDGAVAVAMRNLAPTSGTQVYEAWLIAGSAAPDPVGSFVVGANGVGALQASVAAPAGGVAVVIALTREPGPGATTPTLPILAHGQATAASS